MGSIGGMIRKVLLVGTDGAPLNPIPVSEGTAQGTKRTPAAPTAVTTSASQIVAANADRLHLHIENVGSDTVYLGGDNTITSSIYTVRLFPGEALEDNVGSDAWFAICAAGDSSSLAWDEWE